MRPLRHGAVMSHARAAHRRRYATYLASERWLHRRRVWLDNFRTRERRDPVCAVCEKPWTLDDDLHHASYANLANERDHDLIPMDRRWHEALHQILDTSRAWRAMPRPAATTGIIAVLRARRQDR